ncbi:MAG: hypothetical protein WB777_14275 [Mycobacterium sp.]
MPSGRIDVLVRGQLDARPLPFSFSSLGVFNPSTVTIGGAAGGWIYGANGTYQPLAATSGVPASAALTPHTGSFTVTTAGTTISNLIISGGIDIKAANVTFSSCLITGAASKGTAVVDCRWTGCVNALVTDCEIAATTFATSLNACMGHDVTWQRCNIHKGTDGVRSATNNNDGASQASHNANVNLLGNYIHGLAGWVSDPSQGGGPSHNDPWQPEGGNYNVAIGNNFDGRIDPTLGNGTATASNWNGGNHPSAGALNTNSCIQWDVNTTTTITTGCVMNNNWFDYGYIAINGAFANGSANHFDSIQNNQYGHHTTSGVQINLVGTTVGTLAGNRFADNVGSITVHS